jgi:hypothetical protein
LRTVVYLQPAGRPAAHVRLNELAHAIFGHIARVRNEGPQ